MIRYIFVLVIMTVLIIPVLLIANTNNSYMNELFEDNEITSEMVIKQIEEGKDVSYDNVTIIGNMNLCNLYYGKDNPNVSKSNSKDELGNESELIKIFINNKIYLNNCTITGNFIAFEEYADLDVGTVVVRIVNFKEDVILNNCIIDGDLILLKNHFSKALLLTNTIINNECKFSENNRLQNLVLNGNVNLSRIELNNFTFFDNSVFNGSIEFDNMILKGGVSFKDIVTNNKLFKEFLCKVKEVDPEKSVGEKKVEKATSIPLDDSTFSNYNVIVVASDDS